MLLARQAKGVLAAIAERLIDSAATLQATDTTNGAPWAPPTAMTALERYRLAIEYVLAGVA